MRPRIDDQSEMEALASRNPFLSQESQLTMERLYGSICYIVTNCVSRSGHCVQCVAHNLYSQDKYHKSHCEYITSFIGNAGEGFDLVPDIGDSEEYQGLRLCKLSLV